MTQRKESREKHGPPKEARDDCCGDLPAPCTHKLPEAAFVNARGGMNNGYELPTPEVDTPVQSQCQSSRSARSVNRHNYSFHSRRGKCKQTGHCQTQVECLRQQMKGCHCGPDPQVAVATKP